MKSEREDLLRYQLHRELLRPRPGRPLSTIHASELTKESPEFCPREHALHRLLGLAVNDETPTAAIAMVHRMGRDMGESIVQLAADAGLAVGNWTCSCGARWDFQRRPLGCECGSTSGFRYEELRFTSRVSGASCGIDLLARLPGRERLVVVEIKGEQKDEFQALAMVRGEHRVRTSLYLRIIDESGDPTKRLIDTQEARVLYVTKGGYGVKDPTIADWALGDGPWSPFREFRVKRDDEATQMVSDRARAVVEAERAGTTPAGICATQFVRRAASCRAVHACFSGRHRPGDPVRA